MTDLRENTYLSEKHCINDFQEGYKKGCSLKRKALKHWIHKKDLCVSGYIGQSASGTLTRLHNFLKEFSEHEERIKMKKTVMTYRGQRRKCTENIAYITYCTSQAIRENR